MSGYRSLKRVLGETNLERKVRWIFGTCITLLILLTFSSVGLIAKRLVDETTNHKGRNLARNLLFKLHWEFWTKDVEGPERAKVVEQLSSVLAQEKHESRILRLDESQPSDPVERQIVANLKRRAEEQYRTAAIRQNLASPGAPQKGVGGTGAEIFDDPQFEPVFDPVPAPDQDLYYYYQVVDWSNVCLGCHEALHGGYGDAASTTYEGSVFDNPATPFRVIRVTMPIRRHAGGDEPHAGPCCWAVGILPRCSLAMVAMFWAVVRVHRDQAADSPPRRERRSQPAATWPNGPRSTLTTSSKIPRPCRSTSMLSNLVDRAGRAALGQRRARCQGRRAGPAEHAAL
jgi:hypothetical protein